MTSVIRLKMQSSILILYRWVFHDFQGKTLWLGSSSGTFKYFNKLLNDQMVAMAPLYLSGDTKEWHQGMEKTWSELTWGKLT